METLPKQPKVWAIEYSDNDTPPEVIGVYESKREAELVAEALREKARKLSTSAELAIYRGWAYAVTERRLNQIW